MQNGYFRWDVLEMSRSLAIIVAKKYVYYFKKYRGSGEEKKNKKCRWYLKKVI